MAAANWYPAADLNQSLREDYGRFNLFQWIRMWLRKPRVCDSIPIEQGVRFRADLSAAFPGRQITHLDFSSALPKMEDDVNDAAECAEITTPNYCVASALGPLPEPFFEWIRDQQRSGNYATRDFLDLFNNRLNILRYRIKQTQEVGLNSLAPEKSLYAQYLAALSGVYGNRMSDQIDLPARVWLGMSGLLANCRKSAVGLTQTLSLLLDTPVKLVPLVGSWQRIVPADRHALGQRNHRLGETLVLGTRVWDQQSRIRLDIGKLSYARYCTLLPDRAWLTARTGRSGQPSDVFDTKAAPVLFKRFVSLLHLLIDRRFDCEVHLQIDGRTIPPSKLISRPPDASLPTSATIGMRLGQTAWLGNQKPAHHRLAGSRFLVPAFDNGASS